MTDWYMRPLRAQQAAMRAMAQAQETLMKRRTIIRLGGFVGLIFVCGISFGCWQRSSLGFVARPPTPTRPPDQVLASHVLDGQPVPAGGIKVQVAEGPIAFGYSNPPLFVRFEATQSFIKEMVEKDYGMYGMYSLMPCDKSPIKDGMIQTE